MGKIINLKNFNRYIGRYLKGRRRAKEIEIGWDIYDSLIEKFPICAIRNRNGDDENRPLSWEKNRNLPIAINLVLNSLKSWQAYRPQPSKQVVKKLTHSLPDTLITLQNKLLSHKIYKAKDINKLEKQDYKNVITYISKCVSFVSSTKKGTKPMLGSKVLHHFFPEIVPVWDTTWIGNKALRKYWVRSEVISSNFSNPAMREYGRYLELMLADLRSTPRSEYLKIKKAIITHTGISKEVIDWHFNDLTPIIFEYCLLGAI